MAKPEEFVVLGGAKTAGVRKVAVRERVAEAQLEKSSVSSFKMIPSRVMNVEPQDKLIAAWEYDRRPA